MFSDVIEIIIGWMVETYHGWKPEINEFICLWLGLSADLKIAGNDILVKEGSLLSVQMNLIISTLFLIPSDKIMYFEYRFMKSEIIYQPVLKWLFQF